MNTDHDRQPAGHSNHDDHRWAEGTESPRELLAVHDPSKQRSAGRTAVHAGHGVSVHWLRPTELAARVAARSAAGAVAAHAGAHRQVLGRLRIRGTSARTEQRGRLAPLSAFGRAARVEHIVPDRSVVGR